MPKQAFIAKPLVLDELPAYEQTVLDIRRKVVPIKFLPKAPAPEVDKLRELLAQPPESI